MNTERQYELGPIPLTKIKKYGVPEGYENYKELIVYYLRVLDAHVLKKQHDKMKDK